MHCYCCGVTSVLRSIFNAHQCPISGRVPILGSIFTSIVSRPALGTLVSVFEWQALCINQFSGRITKARVASTVKRDPENAKATRPPTWGWIHLGMGFLYLANSFIYNSRFLCWLHHLEICWSSLHRRRPQAKAGEMTVNDVLMTVGIPRGWAPRLVTGAWYPFSAPKRVPKSVAWSMILTILL